MSFNPLIVQSLTKRNNVNIKGKGKQAILFIHGFGCNQNMWRFITPAFEQKYRVILIDLVGSGNSDNAAYDFDKYSNLQGYADDIIEICEVFELEQIILVGHSVSAIIAGLASISRPELFNKLAMICPSPRYLNDEVSGYVGGLNKSDIDSLIDSLNSNYLGWSSAIAPVITGNTEKTEFNMELTNSFCRNNPEIAQHFAMVIFTGDNRSDLKLIQLPTLIIQTKFDVLAPIEVGYYVHEQITNSTLKILKANGHCPHLTAPEKTLAPLLDFINI